MLQGHRRLAAIMFTDIAGYTALGQRNESLSLAMVEEHRKLVRPILDRHNGREVKTMGDAFLAEFPSALDAVRCGYDIQRTTREFNISMPPEKRISLRVGVHLGDIVESQGDISGDAVNVASRIESLAENGGVCLTRQVYDHVQNKFELPMKSLGRRPLKNVSVPVEVYRIIMPWDDGGPAPSLQLDARRIAVLPFANMSPDPNDEYFADGMTEEVIATLSRIEGLEVISRTSVMQYKKVPKPIIEVSKELDVGTIVEGSIRKAGNKLRVSAQMIDAMRDRHLWAENYDRDLQDVFMIQSDIAKKVGEALQARLPKVTPRAIEHTDNLEAYTMHLRAMQLYHEYDEPSLRQAVELFELSISKDPTFARAYAGLSYALCGMANGGYEDFVTAIRRAEVAARRAVELGPELSEAHAAMAYIHDAMDRCEEAVSEAEKAIQINPNQLEAYLTLGMVHASQGRLEQGASVLRKACELDPLSLIAGHRSALVFSLAGKEEEALDLLTRLQKFHPRNPRIYVSLAEFYMIKRDLAKSQEMLNAGFQISPSEPSLLLDQGLLYAFSDRRREAEDVLKVIMSNERESVRLFGQLFIQSALGNLDEAFKALERQAQTHSWPSLIKSSPVFDKLRKDPRFAEFCLKVGLPA